MKKMIFNIFLVLCLTGCWNYKELNEYSIVTGIAIDKIQSDYKVSVLISNVPKNSGSESNKSSSDIVVYEGNGKSIFEAFKDISLISPKELYLNSFSILIISEDVAKDGINGVLDFFLRYSSSRNNFDVVIAKDNLAKDTLKILTSITNSPSQSISDNLKTTTDLQGAIKTVSFDDLTSILVKDGIDPTINTVFIVGNAEKGATKEILEMLESGMTNFSSLAEKVMHKSAIHVPGAGAAGGLGWAFCQFFEAELKSGIETILDLYKFDEAVQKADLVISGEGHADGQSVDGKLLSGLGKTCGKYDVPLIAIVGGMSDGAEKLMDLGVSSIITTINDVMNIDYAMEHSYRLLKSASSRALRLIKAGMKMKP